MAESASTKKRYTYEDYLKTPDDERYELIEGAVCGRSYLPFRICF